MWGGEFYTLMILAFGGVMLGVIGYAIAMVTTRGKPTIRIRRIGSLVVALVGYLVGSIVGVMAYHNPWVAFAGLFIGAVLGYLFGLCVGEQLRERSKGNSV